MDRPEPLMPQALRLALDLWPQAAQGARLQQIYTALPATNCARQGACCALLPPVHPVEALAFLRELVLSGEQKSCDTAAMLVGHFLQNAARRLPCPWALPDACARYGQRFFGCRAYGLWSAKAHEPRRRQSLQAAERVQAAWQSMGITLPDAVCAPPPAYCAKVAPVNGPAVDDNGLDKLESELAGMGRDQPWHALLMQCGGDLSYLTAGLALGWQECLQAKVALTRDLLSGKSAEADNLLRQAQQTARVWAGRLLGSQA